MIHIVWGREYIYFKKLRLLIWTSGSKYRRVILFFRFLALMESNMKHKDSRKKGF